VKDLRRRGGSPTRPSLAMDNSDVTRGDQSEGRWHRRSIRLPGYDYSSPGFYYVTICVRGRALVLGDIHDEAFFPSLLGTVVAEFWKSIPEYSSNLSLDEYVVMPNHLHGIVAIDEVKERAGHRPSPTGHALPDIIRRFKTFSATRINGLRQSSGPFWQRNYYEHRPAPTARATTLLQIGNELRLHNDR
jgi:REP element-mobilizing transposase RayT